MPKLTIEEAKPLIKQYYAQKDIESIQKIFDENSTLFGHLHDFDILTEGSALSKKVFEMLMELAEKKINELDPNVFANFTLYALKLGDGKGLRFCLKHINPAVFNDSEEHKKQVHLAYVKGDVGTLSALKANNVDLNTLLNELWKNLGKFYPNDQYLNLNYLDSLRISIIWHFKNGLRPPIDILLATINKYLDKSRVIKITPTTELYLYMSILCVFLQENIGIEDNKQQIIATLGRLKTAIDINAKREGYGSDKAKAEAEVKKWEDHSVSFPHAQDIRRWIIEGRSKVIRFEKISQFIGDFYYCYGIAQAAKGNHKQAYNLFYNSAGYGNLAAKIKLAHYELVNNHELGKILRVEKEEKNVEYELKEINTIIEEKKAREEFEKNEHIQAGLVFLEDFFTSFFEQQTDVDRKYPFFIITNSYNPPDAGRKKPRFFVTDSYIINAHVVEIIDLAFALHKQEKIKLAIPLQYKKLNKNGLIAFLLTFTFAIYHQGKNFPNDTIRKLKELFASPDLSTDFKNTLKNNEQATQKIVALLIDRKFSAILTTEEKYGCHFLALQLLTSHWVKNPGNEGKIQQLFMELIAQNVEVEGREGLDFTLENREDFVKACINLVLLSNSKQDIHAALFWARVALTLPESYTILKALKENANFNQRTMDFIQWLDTNRNQIPEYKIETGATIAQLPQEGAAELESKEENQHPLVPLLKQQLAILQELIDPVWINFVASQQFFSRDNKFPFLNELNRLVKIFEENKKLQPELLASISSAAINLKANLTNINKISKLDEPNIAKVIAEVDKIINAVAPAPAQAHAQQRQTL